MSFLQLRTRLTRVMEAAENAWLTPDAQIQSCTEHTTWLEQHGKLHALQIGNVDDRSALYDIAYKKGYVRIKNDGFVIYINHTVALTDAQEEALEQYAVGNNISHVYDESNDQIVKFSA